ncbi:MAG: ribonuclease HII, partial [Candidatus Methanoperedens sp.]|nr:ribonuclease HII [Candidatus Methanoperedens sp.]
MISGIDEAGKGPVLGPMCVAGVLLNENKLDALTKIGVKDSKQLTAKRREILAVEIKKLVDKYFILEVSPFQIDELRKIMTMNEIMVVSYAKVLEELKPDHAFVDAADVIADRFGENIRKKYTRDLEITSEHNADVKYPIVSAGPGLAEAPPLPAPPPAPHARCQSVALPAGPKAPQWPPGVMQTPGRQ